MDYALQEMVFWNREVAEFALSIFMHQPGIAGILQEITSSRPPVFQAEDL